jgi:predicted nucleotidyltransferase
LDKGSHRIEESGQSKMSKIARILQKKEERRKKLQRSLNSIVQSLKEMGAQKIILFGSLASGDVDVNSDLDLFVLMPSAKTGKEWTNIIYHAVERKVASHIIAFNQDEFRKELPTSSFLGNILKGKVLYEKAA